MRATKTDAYLVGRRLLAATLALACLTAHADNWPLSLSISETLSRDSNLYRVEPTQYSIADTVASTGLKIALDKSYGRQRYYANLGTALNRYFEESKLNNTSYDLNLNITSEFTDKGFLKLGGGTTQNLARFDVASSNNITSEKNTQTTSFFDSQISYGGYGLFNPYLAFNHFQQGFTFTSSNYQAMNQNTFSLGSYYALVPQLSLGLGLRLTRGDISYDRGDGESLIDNLRRRDIDLSASWVVTGLSSLYARLSSTHSKESFENSLNLDSTSKGWTGEFNWAYTPQGRLSYSLGYTRDSGNVGRGYDISGNSTATQTNENNRLANTLNGKITWDASYKIKFNSAFQFTRYRLYQTTTYTLGGDTLVQGDPNSDKSIYRQFSIGGQYQFARWVNLYCDIRRIKRTEDADYRPFNATVTACTGQFNINGMN